MFFQSETDLINRYISPGTESKTEKISVLSRVAESKKNFTDTRVININRYFPEY